MTEEEKKTEEDQSPDPARLQFLDVAGVFFNQAAMSLGLAPHPMTGKPFVSFEAAQEGITILEILREKTEGNLEENEGKTLTRMIDELKMAFVEAVLDPKVRELAEQTKQAVSGKPDQKSKIITPDGQPASTADETPKIVIP